MNTSSFPRGSVSALTTGSQASGSSSPGLLSGLGLALGAQAAGLGRDLVHQSRAAPPPLRCTEQVSLSSMT